MNILALKRQLLPMSGFLAGGGSGGGGGGQTTSTTNTSNIPPYAQPYVETMLGATQKQLFEGTPTGDGGFNITGFKPYKAYGGTYDEQGNQISYDPGKAIAGFSPLQNQAQQGIAGMQTPGEYGAAKGVTGAGIMNAANIGANQNPQNFQQQVGGYMNPYMQQVLNPQMDELRRQYGISGTQQASQATQAGAFGGSRDAIMASENNRNLMNAQNQAIGNAYNNAFGAAQNQYNTGQGMQLQANNAAMQGASQLAGLGQQELAAQQGIYGLQNQIGATQQALEQQKINQAMTDYANAQQYPLMQLGTMSNMLRGLPMQATTTNQYAAAPNAITQGIGAAGAVGSLLSANKAKGGIIDVPSYNVGGAVEADLEDMDIDGLKRQAKESSSPRIKQMAQRILAEKQMATPRMAGGGIIAFAKGDKVEAEDAAVAPLAGEPSMDGIMLAKADIPTAKPAAKPTTDYAAQTQADYEAAKKEAARSTTDFYQDVLAAKKAAGVDQDTARQELRSQEMARRANLGDEAERQRNMRLAEFFASWGSTPGPTLVAGMSALKKSIPGMVEDTKEAKKLERESDKIVYDIDEAIRLEKMGDIDKATALKEKAATRAQTLNKELLVLQQHRETNAAHIKAAEISKSGHIEAAGINAKHRETQEYAQILKLESSALKDLDAAKKNQNLAPWLTILDRAAADPKSADPNTVAMAQANIDRAMGDKMEKLKSIRAEKARLARTLGYDSGEAPAPTATPVEQGNRPSLGSFQR